MCVSKMSPHILILYKLATSEHQFFSQTERFLKKILFVEDSMYVTNLRTAISSARWLICRNRMPSKIVATGILVFDFELFIGGRCLHVVCVFHYLLPMAKLPNFSF
jgi:hypothetical protein